MTLIPSLVDDEDLRARIRQFVALGTCVKRNDPCPTCVTEIGEVINIVEYAKIEQLHKLRVLTLIEDEDTEATEN